MQIKEEIALEESVVLVEKKLGDTAQDAHQRLLTVTKRRCFVTVLPQQIGIATESI